MKYATIIDNVTYIVTKPTDVKVDGITYPVSAAPGWYPLEEETVDMSIYKDRGNSVDTITGNIILRTFPNKIGYTERDKTVFKIQKLEESITPRRLREALSGSTESLTFIKDVEDKISILRELL